MIKSSFKKVPTIVISQIKRILENINFTKREAAS